MSLDPDRLSSSEAIQITNAKKAVDIPYPISLFNQHRCSLQTHELPHHCYKREEKRDMRKNRNRYRTQPITFDEIKEVDEETVEMGAGQTDTQVGSLTNVLRQSDLRMNFLEFSKNLEGAVARKISTTSRQYSDPYSVDTNQPKIVVVTSRNNQKS